MRALEDAAGCVDFNIPDKLHPTGARKHDLVGANRFMIEILGEDYGADVPDDPYKNAATNVDLFLPTSATLEVTFPTQVSLEQGIEDISATVTNNSGHKLPTGYSEGRVMWLEVTARYAGEVVYSSGRWDDELLEIEDDAQLRRYEAIAEDADDGTQLHLLRNNRWLKDTRIPPKGLIEDIQTDPINADYVSSGGVWPHQDEASFAFPAAEVIEVEGAAPEIELSVRLLYLINTTEYINHLADANSTNSAGEDLAARFEAAGHARPMVVAEQSATLPLQGLMPMPAGETGSTGETETGSTDNSSSSSDSTGDTSDTTVDEGPAGTCACRTQERSPGAPALLGLIGLVWWRRRREPQNGS
jgi:MYXO-CTERM domain-containing protein